MSTEKFEKRNKPKTIADMGIPVGTGLIMSQFFKRVSSGKQRQARIIEMGNPTGAFSEWLGKADLKPGKHVLKYEEKLVNIWVGQLVRFVTPAFSLSLWSLTPPVIPQKEPSEH